MIHWERHKPRVIRRRWKRTLATVCPDLTRRGWLWVIDRLNGPQRIEYANGRCKKRIEAVALSESIAPMYDAIFTAENEARIERG